MKFIAWPEIEGFHNIRKFIRVDPGEWWQKTQLFAGTSKVLYRAKVKLHGTNAAIQIHKDGSIVPQSRESLLSLEKDNAGFARWVKQHEALWQDTMNCARVQVIVYGEWIGPGIQKNVAVSEIPKKCFAVFAARPLGADGLPLGDLIWSEPETLAEIVKGIPDTYVLPWYEKTIEIDWRQSDEELTATIAPINDWVLAIEANDPWVEATFGVKGTGEGLVFYPSTACHFGFECFTNLVFKAKGEKHKNIKTAAPVQVNAEVVASVDAFVALVLTEARLEQGATKVSADGALTYDMKNLGKFIAWVSGDVQKETQDELEASSLTWKQVQKPLTDKAREWYKVRA